jgi:hypothetical protein
MTTFFWPISDVSIKIEQASKVNMLTPTCLRRWRTVLLWRAAGAEIGISKANGEPEYFRADRDHAPSHLA